MPLQNVRAYRDPSKEISLLLEGLKFSTGELRFEKGEGVYLWVDSLKELSDKNYQIVVTLESDNAEARDENDSQVGLVTGDGHTIAGVSQGRGCMIFDNVPLGDFQLQSRTASA